MTVDDGLVRGIEYILAEASLLKSCTSKTRYQICLTIAIATSTHYEFDLNHRVRLSIVA